ncbi:MAG: NB-ARC domain-containing protein, partial [Rhizonema sp. NSF051]|nr:NB-ARC domain-containing protein [Rhizonema sp. NSF051]
MEKLEQELIGNQTTQKKRIIYLTGNAGVGKSTLAYYFAEKYEKDKNKFKDGIVGLRVNSEEKETQLSIARRLINLLKKHDRTIELNDEEHAIDAIKYFFSSKEFLIILDNASKNIVDILCNLFYDNHSRCAVIVTTRDQDLSKYVETFVEADSTTINIPKFEIYESLELVKEFMEKKDFDKREQYIAEEIVRIIDNLPLALRISGSTLKGFKERYKDNSEKYYEELEKYTNSLRNAKERLKQIDQSGYNWSELENEQYHWSVEASLEISLNLLTTNERDEIISFFASLSVCAEEGFSQEAAKVISNCDEASTSKYLNRLCTLSLIDQSGDNTSYYVLHPLVYSFACNKLKELPTQNDQLQERHAEFFLKKVKLFDTDENYENLEEDKPNILKALAWLEQALFQTSQMKELRERKKTFKRFLLRRLSTFL